MTPDRIRRRRGAWLVALALAALTLGGCDRPPPAVEPVDFELEELLAGGDVRLEDFAGDVVLLNFWTSWCAPCRIEIPELMKLQRRYKDRGVTIIGVVMDEPDGARELARELGVNYTNVVGTEAFADSLGGIRGFPTSFLLDRERKPVLRFSGLAPTRTLEQEILAVIGQPG